MKMIEKTIKKIVYEKGDVLELKKPYLSNKCMRQGLNKVRAVVIKTTIQKTGTITTWVIKQDFNKETLREELLDHAEYIGKMDLAMLIGDE